MKFFARSLLLVVLIFAICLFLVGVRDRWGVQLLADAASPAASSDDFVITVKTDNPGSSSDTQFTIPTTGGGYNYNVDCNNDGIDEATGVTGGYTCNYPSAGAYTIRIKDNTGAKTGFPRIYFNNGGDRRKLLTVEQWGTGQWTSMAHAFHGCTNLTVPATDAPDLSNVTDMSYMFRDARAFNQDIGGWDTANVTDMSYMFSGASAFNQDIGDWNTANVTDMNGMFDHARAFNQNIGDWNTANVTDMSDMFNHASAFDQDIGGWNTANVTDMSYMFHRAWRFNGDIGGWNTANVTDMRDMFGGSTFDQDIGGWNTANVTNMRWMFNGAFTFNQDIGGWNTANVTDMGGMFSGASAFNQDIGDWNTTNVTNMSGMFERASAFNQDIGGWNTANVITMWGMFYDADAFNGDIGGWNTANVTDMSDMFLSASAFNQDIGGWNTANVTNMSSMFRKASAFNQDIGGWNTANVTNMNDMFGRASAFDQDIGGWDVTALTNAGDMFRNAALSTANYDALLMGWDAQALQRGVWFDGGASTYCNGEAARADMISTHGWSIIDGGKSCPTPTPTATPVWRFDGVTYRGDVTTPLSGVTLRLYGSNDGPAGPGDWMKSTLSNADGYFSFHIISPWNYQYFTLVAEPPSGLVAVQAWSSDGEIVAPDTIRWINAQPISHHNRFIFDVPTPTPTVTPTPTPAPERLWLPIMFSQS